MPIRGLEIRVKYAKALVLSVTDTEEADLDAREAHMEAEKMGYDDYWAGQEDCPAMFDDSTLADSWRRGKFAASDRDEMAHCSGCKEANGDPCPVHG